ncbi:hypothetical protein BaRGS_00007136 [Batillaria attramentaria]|uniref:Uncharacterized protein n=1 Tax=Batillaria attramentaria TaxID=370345 RepID=A0ABD0LR30_9CAEN
MLPGQHALSFSTHSSQQEQKFTAAKHQQLIMSVLVTWFASARSNPSRSPFANRTYIIGSDWRAVLCLEELPVHLAGSARAARFNHPGSPSASECIGRSKLVARTRVRLLAAVVTSGRGSPGDHVAGVCAACFFSAAPRYCNREISVLFCSAQQSGWSRSGYDLLWLRGTLSFYFCRW